MRTRVQRLRQLKIAILSDLYYRLEDDFLKMAAAVFREGHRALSIVRIFCDDNVGFGAKMQVPKHVAGRERRDEKLFRVVARAVAAKRWIGRTRNERLSFRVDFMRA